MSSLTRMICFLFSISFYRVTMVVSGASADSILRNFIAVTESCVWILQTRSCLRFQEISLRSRLSCVFYALFWVEYTLSSPSSSVSAYLLISSLICSFPLRLRSFPFRAEFLYILSLYRPLLAVFSDFPWLLRPYFIWTRPYRPIIESWHIKWVYTGVLLDYYGILRSSIGISLLILSYLSSFFLLIDVISRLIWNNTNITEKSLFVLSE